MMNRVRVGTKLSTHMFFAAISCFRINSVFSVFIPKQGNPNPFIIISSSSLQTSNQYTLRREDLSHAFECITNIDEAVSLFHYMLQMKPKPSIHNYNNLFTSIARIEHSSHVVKMEHYSKIILMFKKLRLLGWVDEYTMNIVINCYAHLRQVYLSYAVIGASFKRGYTPGIVTFNCLIKGFFLRGEVVEAVGLFNKLIKRKLCEVDEYTIATVLDGIAKSGNVVDIVHLLQIAEKNNWKLGAACYNVVIDALCKGGMIEDGMDTLFRMIDRGVLPNVITYTSFIHGLCMNGKLEFACSIFNDLPSKGICPNVITYTVIVQGFCRKALFEDAKEVLEKMERVGCFPDDITYNVIVQGCLHHAGSFGSINLLKHIVGRDFQLDAPSFFVLLRRIRVQRRVKGVYDDDDVINHLIRKLLSSGAIHQMEDIDYELITSRLMQKLNSSDSICSTS